IEQLKGKDRGVRDDYRLRSRLADAEALARRLTELEARLGTNRPNRGSTLPRPPETPPQASPGDGPAELEAKADILTDQSRRLRAQADTPDRRLPSIKDRLELRRRAGQLENDPFAPLEGSKRRIVSGAVTAPTAGGAAGTKASDSPAPPRGAESAGS